MDSSDTELDSAPDHEGPSRSRVRRAALAGALALLGSSLLLRSSTLDIEFLGLAGSAILAGAGLLVVLALLVPSADAIDGDQVDETDGDVPDDGDSSVWNAIPPWQYEGRHVESGGLARGEQERALEEIQQEAEELSDDP